MKVNKKLNHFKRQTQLFTLVEQVILFVFYEAARGDSNATFLSKDFFGCSFLAVP